MLYVPAILGAIKPDTTHVPVASVTTLVIVMGESAVNVMVRPAKKVTCYLTSVDFK